MGQYLRCRRSCMLAPPGTHSWLASPQTYFQISPCNCVSCIVTTLEVWVALLHLCILKPRSLHLYVRGSYTLPYIQPPFSPFIQFAPGGWQLTGLELRHPMIYCTEMDSSRIPPQKIVHATTHQPRNLQINILHNCASTTQGLLPLFAPKAHGALSQTFSKAQRTAKETLASSSTGLSLVHHVSFMRPPCPSPFPFHSLFLITAPLLAALILTAVPLTVAAAAAAAAAAADLTAFTPTRAGLACAGYTN
eukprot:1149248-Pelagomonas_calceolata.AAC.8